MEANHWATDMIDAWAWSYFYKKTNGTWSTTIWPNTQPYIVGAPSASGYLDGFAVWHHSFDGR